MKIFDLKKKGKKCSKIRAESIFKLPNIHNQLIFVVGTYCNKVVTFNTLPMNL